MAKHELTTGNDVVRLGDVEFTQFVSTVSDPYSFFHYVADRFKFQHVTMHPRDLNKLLHENFGSKIPYRFSSAMYNTFVAANFPVETRYVLQGIGYHWARVLQPKVNHALKFKHFFAQAVKDNTINVLPLMLNYEQDTEGLKKIFGKGAWKKITSMSKTRVMYLSRLLSYSDFHPDLLSVRSGILRLMNGVRTTELLAAKLSPTVKDFTDTYMLLNDTVFMFKQRGLEYNSQWSLNRWKEEHDKIYKKILLEKFSEEPFEESLSCTSHGYTFTLLNNQLDIAKEGSLMGHCVGSYAGRCEKGVYAVFRVEGEERATLGLRMVVDLLENTNIFVRDQCYGKYNSSVSDKLRTVARIISDNYTMYKKDGKWLSSISKPMDFSTVSQKSTSCPTLVMG